jgi:hypothetical protein
MTEKTNLERVSGALVEFKSVDAGLAALREKHAGVVFDVETKAGFEAAKAARAEVRAPRLRVEQIRKDAKAPLLQLGRELDAEAKRITEALEAIETPIDKQIKAEEERKERERQAAIARESERVTEIRRRIDAIRGWPSQYAGQGSLLLNQQVQLARGYVIGPEFAEFQDEAARALALSIEALERELAGAQKREEEKAELDRLRAEQAKRDAEAKAQREAEERAAAERRAAEEAELKARREKLEQEEREARAQREAERQARETDERRVRAIRHQIHEIHSIVTTSAGSTPAAIALSIESLTHLPIDVIGFAEFEAEAELARTNAIAALQVQHTIALQREQKAREDEQRALAEQAEREAITAAGMEVVEVTEVFPSIASPGPGGQLGTIVAPPALAAEFKGPPAQPSPRQIIDLVSTHYGVSRDTAISWLRTMFAVRAA